MAAREAGKVRVHVTGFGSFRGVSDNPTSRLAAALPGHLSAMDPAPAAWELCSCTVAHVSARGCREALDAIEADSGGGEAPAVWLHFGVAGHYKSACLETTAYNEATFRCPDEDGDTPVRQKIDDGLDLAQAVTTAADAEAARERLAALGHNVGCSSDAGRFVCNWMAMASMRRASRRTRTLSLFCHMPPSSVIGEADALRLAMDLIECLAAQAGRPSRR